MPLAVELITHTVAFVMLLCANKGYYKHTVFWTINIKLLSIGRYLSMDPFLSLKRYATRQGGDDIYEGNINHTQIKNYIIQGGKQL